MPSSGNTRRGQTLTVFEPPAIVFGPAPSRSEGDAGVRALQFVVRLTQPATNVVTVDYFTSDLTATNGVDYLATNGSLTFAIGQTTNIVTGMTSERKFIMNAKATITSRKY